MKTCIYRTTYDLKKPCNCGSSKGWVRCLNERRIANIEKIQDVTKFYSRLIDSNGEAILLVNATACQEAHCTGFKSQ